MVSKLTYNYFILKSLQRYKIIKIENENCQVLKNHNKSYQDFFSRKTTNLNRFDKIYLKGKKV